MDLKVESDALANNSARFVRTEVSAHETMFLAGRGLAVTGEILDSATKNFERVNTLTRMLSFIGKLIVGVARILVPGGIEGSIYRQWSTLMLLLSAVLLAISVFITAYRPIALAVLGYTAAAIFVVEAARLVVSHPKPLARILWGTGAVFGLLGLSIVAARWMNSLWNLPDCIDCCTEKPCVAPAVAKAAITDTWAPWDNPSYVTAAGVVLALVFFIGLVWSQISYRVRQANPTRNGILTTVFWTVAPFAAAGALSVGFGWLVRTRTAQDWIFYSYGPGIVIGITWLYFVIGKYVTEISHLKKALTIEQNQQALKAGRVYGIASLLEGIVLAVLLLAQFWPERFGPYLSSSSAKFATAICAALVGENLGLLTRYAGKGPEKGLPVWRVYSPLRIPAGIAAVLGMGGIGTYLKWPESRITLLICIVVITFQLVWSWGENMWSRRG